MQCVNLQKKRSLELEVELEVEVEPWSCRAKRVCLEAELQEAELQPPDCPMETSPAFPSVTQQLQQVDLVSSAPARRCCLRCLGGEPGHINHIMGV